MIVLMVTQHSLLCCLPHQSKVKLSNLDLFQWIHLHSNALLIQWMLHMILKRLIHGVINLKGLLGVTVTMTVTVGIVIKDSEVVIRDPQAIRYDVPIVRRIVVGVYTHCPVILPSIGVTIAILRSSWIEVVIIVTTVRIVICVSYKDGILRMMMIWVSMHASCDCRLFIIGRDAPIRRIREHKLGSILTE